MRRKKLRTSAREAPSKLQSRRRDFSESEEIHAFFSPPSSCFSVSGSSANARRYFQFVDRHMTENPSPPAAKLPAGNYKALVSFQYRGQKLTKERTFTLAGGI
jgi:hypothetical protein